MSNFIGQIEILSPTCNTSTLKDGRGGIFSWIPQDDIKEWSLLYFSPNKVRGNHFHPHFTEYFLIVEGSVVLFTRDSSTGKEITTLAGPGFCFRTPPGVPHAVHAVTSSVCVSFLSEKWDSVTDPIVYEDLTEFDTQYLQFVQSEKQQKPKGRR